MLSKLKHGEHAGPGVCPSSVLGSVRRGAHALSCVPECGAAFTSKLEGMFKDMELSKDIMVQFKQASRVFVQVKRLYVSSLTLRYVKPSALKMTLLASHTFE